MKLATWNVNSLKVRLPHLTDWLAASGTDVICLQETKLEDPNFPRQRIVEDRNRITGGGVTAGLDFGLLLAAQLRGQTYAEAV